MIQNQINARFKICALSIYGTGNEVTTRGGASDKYCQDAKAVTECFLKYIIDPLEKETIADACEVGFPSKNLKTGETKVEPDPKGWYDNIMTYINTDNINYVNCLEVNV